METIHDLPAYVTAYHPAIGHPSLRRTGRVASVHDPAEERGLLGSLALGLHGMVGWRHAFGDVTPDTRFTFDGGGTGFTIAGAPIARDAALIEAGADADLGDGITLSLSYSGQAAPDSWTNGVAGDVRFRF